MDFNDIESKIEQTENDVESTTEKLEIIENKESSIKEALHRLREDIETSEVLSAKITDRESERKELENKIEKYKSIAQELEDTINSMIEANNQSSDVLIELAALGEDVEEGLETVKERKIIIDKCKEELQNLLDQLNMVGSFSAHSLESGINASESDNNTNKSRNFFIQSLRVPQPIAPDSSADTASSNNSTAASGTPSTDQRELEIAHTTGFDRDDGASFLSDISSAWTSKLQQEEMDTSNYDSQVRNQILVGRIDECVDLFGWKRKTDLFSLEEDLKAVNPNYYTKMGLRTSNQKWLRNCQRCVIALEARLRGADVKATERIFDGSDTLPIMKHPDGWPSAFINPTLTKCSGASGIDTGVSVIRKMKEYGDGSRAIVRVQFCDTIEIMDHSGKIEKYAVENLNGVTTICDIKSRTPVDIAPLFPNHDFSRGIEIERIKGVGTILKSQKDGKKIGAVFCPGGHVFTAIQKEGQTVFCDPQTGKIISQPEKYFAVAKHDETYVVRVDNLKFSQRAMDCCTSV